MGAGPALDLAHWRYDTLGASESATGTSHDLTITLPYRARYLWLVATSAALTAVRITVNGEILCRGIGIADERELYIDLGESSQDQTSVRIEGTKATDATVNITVTTVRERTCARQKTQLH